MHYLYKKIQLKSNNLISASNFCLCFTLMVSPNLVSTTSHSHLRMPPNSKTLSHTPIPLVTQTPPLLAFASTHPQPNTPSTHPQAETQNHLVGFLVFHPIHSFTPPVIHYDYFPPKISPTLSYQDYLKQAQGNFTSIANYLIPTWPFEVQSQLSQS